MKKMQQTTVDRRNFVVTTRVLLVFLNFEHEFWMKIMLWSTKIPTVGYFLPEKLYTRNIERSSIQKSVYEKEQKKKITLKLTHPSLRSEPKTCARLTVDSSKYDLLDVDYTAINLRWDLFSRNYTSGVRPDTAIQVELI